MNQDPRHKPEHQAKKPDWLRGVLPSGERVEHLKTMLRELKLHTVCEEAMCPNMGECWKQGTATIMIMGDTCTRGCRFCSVASGKPLALDPHEPEHVAQALAQLDLAYVVLTMVDRDDLDDGGAAHVVETIHAIKSHTQGKLLVETLAGDFQGNTKDIRTVVLKGKPDVFAHNVEVVPSLQRKMRDARCSWQRSIGVLKVAKSEGAITKTSLMVGCGEEPSEVSEALQMIKEAEVDVITIGQYLRPTPKHAPVIRYVHPDEFELWRQEGVELGFKYVASGPLVRSSYKAAEAFLNGFIRKTQTEETFNAYGTKASKHLQIIR